MNASRFVQSALRVRPGEGRRTALLFLHLFLASAVFFLGRTVRDTLFLTRYPLSALPWLFILYAFVSAGVAIAYGRVADRIPRQRAIGVTCAVGAVTYLAAWAAVRADVGFVYPAFYVWTEVVASLFIVQFWTVANDLHDARSARRIFGTIGAARLLAAVLVGFAAGEMVRAVGTEQLILLLVAIMAAIAAVSAATAGEVRIERSQRPGHVPAGTRAPPVLGDPYVRALALLLLVAFTAVNIGDFQFKAVARATFEGDELARFFARFYAVSGSLAFLFQVFVTPWLLARGGVGAGLVVMPLAFGASSAGLFLWPRITAAAILKFADNGFQFTIQESTFQALYVPFAPAAKARTRALLEAVVKPLGFALAGVTVILLGARFAGTPERFALITIPLIALWLGLVPIVRRRYVRRLERTLSVHGFAFEDDFVLDAAGRKLLLRELGGDNASRILVALDQLAGERGPDIRRAVVRLASHREPRVREAAFSYLARAAPAGVDPMLARLALDDTAPIVRAAAALALAALARDASTAQLLPLLRDQDDGTRASALAGLLRHGGPAGAAAGEAELARLLGSPEPRELVIAADALGYLGAAAYQPLLQLLQQGDPRVRRAALRAAADVADPRLVPVLVTLFHEPALRARAGQALVACGEAAAEALGNLLGDPGTARAVRLELPRILRRIPRPSTYALLRRHVAADDSRLRLRVIAALSHLRRDLALPAEPLAFILALVRQEIAEAQRNRTGWAQARARFASPLLEELFRSRTVRVMRRVLRILELRYDPETLAIVRERITDPAQRANAIELLDALLDGPVRALVLPFADDAPVSGARPGTDPVTFMLAHCRHPNPYVVMLALDALARAGEPASGEQARRLLDHPEALVREAARRVAGSRVSQEDQMYSTLEKILILKSAVIFERVLGEDLAPLARVAEAQVHPPGATIVREGDRGDALFIVVRGTASVVRNGRAIATLGAGDSVGEMAVLDSEPRSASVVADGEVEVLRIGSEEFYEVLHEQVEIAEGVIRVLSRRLRRLDEQLAS